MAKSKAEITLYNGNDDVVGEIQIKGDGEGVALAIVAIKAYYNIPVEKSVDPTDFGRPCRVEVERDY